jgi:hypothetical protein
MEKKYLFVGILLVSTLILFNSDKTFADNKWEKEQRKIFEQIPVKPGDVIDQSNWEKLDGILPPTILEWVKRGEEIVKIGELQYNFAADEAYQKRNYSA